MPRSRFQIWPFLVTMLMIYSAPCFAQVQTGTPPYGSFGGGPDIVNLGNLNVHLNVPVYSRAGRGMPLTYSLGYDTSVWSPVNSSGSHVWTPASNWGWTSSTASVTGHLSARVTSAQTCPTYINPHLPPVDEETIYTYTWTYYDSFGGVHPFIGDTTTWTSSPCGSAGSSSLNATATDGSGYTLSANGASGSVYTRKGTLIGPPNNQFSGVGTLTDRNGNVISVDSSGNITDTLGTVALAVAGSGTPSSPITFTYTPPNGTPTAYTANFTSLTVKTNFGCSGVAEFGPTAENLLTSISLPDGTEYTFTYEQTSGFSGDYTGRLASVTLPTGGTITYTYPGSNDGVECSDGSTASLTRTVNPGGEWQYARSGSGTAWTTTITDPTTPTNNQTVLNFQSVIPVAGSAASFYETERKIYQGSTSGTLLKTIFTCYNGATSPCNSTAVAQPISQLTAYVQWPGGLESKINTTYNSYGLVTEKDEYAYGAGSPGSIVRKTVTAYAPLSNGIVGMPSTITIEDGSSNIKAQTTYCYDEGTPSGTPTCAATGPPAATSGTPQHVAVTGSRGNLTTVASLVQSSTYLGKTYTYYDTGNVLIAKDVNGAQTAYSYGTGSCGNSFATSVSEPLSLSRSMTWNCTGGVQTSVTDENTKTVSTTFNDPYFWRENAVTDQNSNVANITYKSATSGEESLVFNSSNSTADILTTLDELGRVQISQLKESPSSVTYDSVETDYNPVGLRNRSTLPYPGLAGATSSSAPGVTATYDALGRVFSTSDSGLGTTTYTYEQNDVLTTSGPPPSGEHSKSRQYEYDALGRLTSVCEITSVSGAGSCAQNTSATGFLTKYSYNLNDNLISVTQNAQSSTTQLRTYVYDDLSRLTSEQNPESGTTLYVYDSDSTCGTYSGDLVKKTDAVGNVICRSYDSLHRLTSVSYPSGSYAARTPNKYFLFDSATVSGVVMSNTKGRMAEAYTATSSTGTKITDLGFSYTARGEISDVYESTAHSGGYYHLNVAYWQNGALNQISGLPTLPTLTYTPDGEGRPAIVTASAGQNPVSATQYNTASLPTSMTLGSTDSDTFTFDTNTDRLTKFQFTVNNQTLTGTLGWNQVGTPATLDISDPFNAADTQNCSYTHDDLTRLATVNCGAIWGQSFTYDAFGNIMKTVLSGSSGISFQPTYSPTTNRIATLPSFIPTYDSNGNLTQDPQHQYSWDSEGRPVTIDSVTLTYDALSRMIEQNSSGVYTQIVYDPLGEKFALMNGQTLTKAFVPLPDGGVAAYTSSGLEYYRHPDWLGSSRLASTPTRGVYADTAYAPFGETYAQSGATDPSFTGQDQNTASNLYDFEYREHSPIQGRWISPDAAGLAAVSPRDPQSWNRYAYVSNRPLLSIDQTGLYCMWDDGTSDDSVVDGGIDEGGCIADGGTWWPDFDPNNPNLNVCSSLGGVPVGCSDTFLGGAPTTDPDPPTDPTYDGSNGGNSSLTYLLPQSNVLNTMTCVQPNFLNRLEIPILQELAVLNNETVGIGLSGNAGVGYVMGFSAGGSGYLVASPNGDVAFVFTNTYVNLFGVVTSPGLLFGPSVLQSTATNPQQLSGPSVGGGAMVAGGLGAGADITFSNGGVITTTTTAGFGAGGKGSAMSHSNTTVIPVCKQD
jgi:RHS repeat-associated protein